MAKPGRPRKDNGGGAPSPGVGDNSKQKPIPTPNMIAAAVTEILDIEIEMAALSGKKGGVFNRFEKQGVDRKLLRGTVMMAKSMTPEEAATFLNGLTKYAAAAEVINIADPAWTASVQQAEMFIAADGETAENLRRARAHREGFQAGKKGHHIQSSPYQAKPGSVEFVGWRDGHVEGMAARVMLKPGSENVTEASTSKARRKPGAAAPTPDAAPPTTDADNSALQAITDQLEQTDGGMIH